MANLLAVHSVGNSLMTLLRNAYPTSLSTPYPCDFRLLSSGEMAVGITDSTTTLSLFLHRITIDEYLRNNGRAGNPSALPTPLSLDLHYLLIVWSANAVAEHAIMAWAMRHLHLHPLLDVSSLSPDAGWTAGDTVHVIPAELSLENTMRVWDAFEAHYRLSVSYIARCVRIDPDTTDVSVPVVATRFDLSEQEVAP
jgi:hypothetical protein